MDYKKLAETFSEFDSQNWIDWIDDILYYGVSSPTNQISPEGDVLEDVCALLLKYNYSTNLYEVALLDVLNKHLAVYPDVNKASRILDVLTIIKSPKAKPALLTYYQLKGLNDLRDENERLKTKILRVAGQLNLTNHEKDIFRKHTVLEFGADFSYDLDLMEAYLRFVFVQFKENQFFSDYDACLGINFGELQTEAVDVLEYKLEEFLYERKHTFFKSFLTWLINNYVNFFENNLYVDVLQKFRGYLTEERNQDYINNAEFDGENVAKISFDILNCLFEYDYFNHITNKEIEEISEILFTEKAQRLAEEIADKNKQFGFLHFGNCTDTGIESYEDEIYLRNQRIYKKDNGYLVEMIFLIASLYGSEKFYTDTAKAAFRDKGHRPVYTHD